MSLFMMLAPLMGIPKMDPPQMLSTPLPQESFLWQVKATTTQSLTFTEAYTGIKEMGVERDSDVDSLEVGYI